MDTQQVSIKLPASGETVLFRPFLTTGQSRELQKILLKKGTFNTEAGKLENVGTETFLEMQDRAAEFLIVGGKSKDGVDFKFTMDWLSNLPVSDGNIVYNKINEITQASNLSAESKKK